ncbi:MAG: glycosyltransferase family 4 protein [Thermosphaera sp.]
MRIAIVTEGFRPYIGGVEARYTKFAEGLARNHEVDVYTVLQNGIPVSSAAVTSEEKDGRLSIYRLHLGDKYFLKDGTRSARDVVKFAKEVTKRLINEEYDAIILSEWPLLHILYLHSNLKLGDRRKLVIDWHEVWDSYYLRYGLKGFLGYVLERQIARLKEPTHIAVSQFTRNRLRKISKNLREIPVITNGIELHEFHENTEREREYGKILFFGRFVPHKGIDKLVGAFAILKKYDRDVKLYIIGDGPLREHVKRLSKMVDGVHVLMSLERRELIKHIKTSWVVVIPSEREGQGISYLEAMAAGTPVVTIKSPLNAFSNMVRNGVEAIVAEPTHNSIAESIHRLMKDHCLWSSLSQNGRKVAQQFTWSSSLKRLEKVLATVCTNG